MSELIIDPDAIITSPPPPGVDAKFIVVLLHGFGSHERDLLPLVHHLGLPATVISLRAPLSSPFPGGFAWYPITSDPGTVSSSARAGVTEALRQWSSDSGLLDQDLPIVPIGFSQGGAMVVELLRSFPERFAAGVVLSGFALERGNEPGPVPSTVIPVFWGYDPDDPIVTDPLQRATRDRLHTEFTVSEHQYRGIGHGVGTDELNDLRGFLQRHLDS